jgi:hypothetical protein
MWELYAFYALLPVLLAARLDGAMVSVRSFAADHHRLSRLHGRRLPFAQDRQRARCLKCSCRHPACAVSSRRWRSWRRCRCSSFNARFAPPGLVGSALMIANCIGF